jgi:CHAT domain-containing protein
MNLSRAFLGAGSRSVLASLWPVSDAGAVEFMTQFYQGLLRERLRPDAALAFAQAKLAKSERFSEPFFWAGFVLVSEEL